MKNNTVLNNGDARRYAICAVFLEHRCRVYDIVHIPFAGLTHGVCQWRSLFVDTSCLSVYVSLVVVAIEYLYLIQPLHEYAAVAACLALAGDVFRNAPFDVQLVVFELLLRPDVARFLVYRHHAVVNRPLCRFALGAFPGGEVFAVEEDDGITRSRVCADIPRCHNFWLRSPIFRHARRHLFLLRILFFLCAEAYASHTSDGCQHGFAGDVSFLHGL